METMPEFRTLNNSHIFEETILYRSPYDIVPVIENGRYVLPDDSRITATLPTLEFLLKQRCKIVILTQVGRPQGVVTEGLRTNAHAKHLSKLLGIPVAKCDDCIGPLVDAHIAHMKPGEVVMLENTRFYPEDDIDDDIFAQKLARNGQMVVFDGFPQAHRHQASVTGILRHLHSCVGFYFQKEYEALSSLLTGVEHPFTVIIGGAKISDKTEAVRNFLELADVILLGGGVANVFMKAQGMEIGSSYLEESEVEVTDQDWVRFAQSLQGKMIPPNVISTYGEGIIGNESFTKIQVPEDVRVELEDGSVDVRLVRGAQVVAGNNEKILDIGPSAELFFSQVIAHSKTVFWNGPLGLTDDDRFIQGTRAIVEAMASTEARTIIAGGDTIATAKKFVNLSVFSHVSLAGGATLEFLSGNKLPVVELLSS